ncbi:hypothetical protein LXL04_000410 [Taraxacum kok-saghyz]
MRWVTINRCSSNGLPLLRPPPVVQIPAETRHSVVLHRTAHLWSATAAPDALIRSALENPALVGQSEWQTESEATVVSIEPDLCNEKIFVTYMLVQMRTIIEFENGGTNLDG